MFIQTQADLITMMDVLVNMKKRNIVMLWDEPEALKTSRFTLEMLICVWERDQSLNLFSRFCINFKSFCVICFLKKVRVNKSDAENIYMVYKTNKGNLISDKI